MIYLSDYPNYFEHKTAQRIYLGQYFTTKDDNYYYQLIDIDSDADNLSYISYSKKQNIKMHEATISQYGFNQIEIIKL